jgi:hypothetical protein
MTSIPSVLVSFLSLWQNTWGNQLLREQGLFWLMVSGVSVHSWLGLLFFEAYSKAEHCGPWEAQGRGNCSSHGNKKAKREEVEGPGFQKPLQVCAPNDFPSTRPYLLKVSPPFNNATGWGPSLQYISLWGTFNIQTIYLTWPSVVL